MILQIMLIVFCSLPIVCAMFGYPDAKPLSSSSYGIQLKLNKWYVRLGEGDNEMLRPLLRDEHYYTVVDRKLYELDNLEFRTTIELRQQSGDIESVEHYCETHKTEVESCSKVTLISKEAALSPIQIIKRQSAGQVAIGKGKDMTFGPLLKFDEFYTAIDRTIYKLEFAGPRSKRITNEVNLETLSGYMLDHNIYYYIPSIYNDSKKSETSAPSSSNNAIPAEDTDANKIDANKTATKTKTDVSPKEEPSKIDPNAKKTSSTHCSVQ